MYTTKMPNLQLQELQQYTQTEYWKGVKKRDRHYKKTRQMLLSGGTFGTNSLYYIIDGTHGESLGQFYLWNLDCLEAIGSVAFFTIKMSMHVRNGTSFAAAHFILYSTAAIFYHMHDMMPHKQAQNPEYTGFVHGCQHCLQLGHRYGASRRKHCPYNQNTIGGRLYPLYFQNIFQFLFHSRNILPISHENPDEGSNFNLNKCNPVATIYSYFYRVF